MIDVRIAVLLLGAVLLGGCKESEAPQRLAEGGEWLARLQRLEPSLDLRSDIELEREKRSEFLEKGYLPSLCQVVFWVPLKALHAKQDSQNLTISFERVSGSKAFVMLVADGVRGFLTLREEMVEAKEPAVEAYIALDALTVEGRD